MFESSVVDSIAVSVFADIFLLSLTNIRRQDPNNYSSDSVAGPCLLGCETLWTKDEIIEFEALVLYRGGDNKLHVF